MASADSDIRYMAVNDLMSELSKEIIMLDSANEKEVVTTVVKLLNDNNGSVQNIAVKCLAPLVTKIKESSLQDIANQLCDFLSPNKREELRDIASIGLKIVVVEFSSDSLVGANLSKRLLPKLLEQLSSAAQETIQIDILDVIAEILFRYGKVLAGGNGVALLARAQDQLLALMSQNRPAVRKRASIAISNLAAITSEEGFSTIIEVVLRAMGSERDREKLRTYLSVVGSLSRASPQRVGNYIPQLMSVIMQHINKDDDELREACLQAFESFILRCPTEMTDHISSIVDICLTYVKYDPNYAAKDDEEESQMDTDEGHGDDGEDEEDEEEEEEGYSDDDDLSWKVRRASAKLLSSIIATRPKLLTELVRTVGPPLIWRFTEHEESVRVDIMQTYITLVTQVGTYHSSFFARGFEDTSHQQKRSRMEIDSRDVKDSASGLIRGQVLLLCRVLPRQLRGKSIVTRRTGFSLLQQLLRAVPGCLHTQLHVLIPSIRSCLASTTSLESSQHIHHHMHTNSDIKIEVLTFLRALFTTTNNVAGFAQHMPALAGLVLDSFADKFHKVVSEALYVLIEMLRLVRPFDSNATRQQQQQQLLPLQGVSQDIIDRCYEVVLNKISATDEEVKDRAIATLGVLISRAGDLLTSQKDQWGAALLDRLRNEITRLTAVKAVTAIIESPLHVLAAAPVVVDIAKEVAGLLKKSNRALRETSIKCLEVLIRRHHDNLSVELFEQVIIDSAPIISEAELHSVPLAIQMNTVLMTHTAQSPQVRARIKDHLLPSILLLVRNPVVHGSTTLDALLVLLEVFVKTSSPQESQALLNELASPIAQNNPQDYNNQAYSTMAECTAVVCLHAGLQPKTVNEFIALIGNIKAPEHSQLFTLLVLGELGRRVDLSSYTNLYPLVLELLNSTSEDVKSAAAFALGSIAIGNTQQYLPIIISEIKGHTKSSYLLFHAIKETLSHHANPQALRSLEHYANDLWGLLFANCEGQVEGTRVVISECLGKLVHINSQGFLADLQQRLHSPSAETRILVLGAIKYTLTDPSDELDALLKPLVVDFLAAMKDADQNVRRVALSSLNAAAHNKPELIRDSLRDLLPLLYQETSVRPELIRTVEMGPFKHQVDDGLETRKTAFECMYTLLENCLDRIDVFAFLERVLVGMTDLQDIKVVSYMMLVKIATLSPTATQQKLDDTVDIFRAVVNQKQKSNAVKQEVERVQELVRAALKAIAHLQCISDPSNTPKFDAFVKDIKSGLLADHLLEVEHDMKQQYHRPSISGRDTSSLMMDMS